MKTMKIGIWTSCFLISAILAVGPQAAAQNSTIEFVAKATPSSGTDEPVRGITFYLLRQSFDDIGKEAAVTYPLVAMDAFIDKLDVSKELKAWMKKNRCVNLAGEDFIKRLKPDDVMNVPEFHKAYVDRMSGDQSVAFPTPKYTPALKKKNPEKYDEEVKQYQNAIRAFLVLNPTSTDGIDLALEDVNPGHKWDTIEARAATARSTSLRKRATYGRNGTYALPYHREKQLTSRFRISTRYNLHTPHLNRLPGM